MGFASKRGGTKVPGSKLKPVPLIESESTQQTTKQNKQGKGKDKGKAKQINVPFLEAEEEDENETRKFHESLRKDKPPLMSFVICFTGIVDPVKSQVTDYAQKLGAKVERALTSDVTHLICEKPGSQKYNVAPQYGIKIMLPLWLETLYSSFTEGEDIDLDEITARYTMKPFHSLKVSITGKASSSRTPIIQLAEDNGASVTMDLDIDCSHLVVLSMAPAKECDSEVFNLEKVQAARNADKPIKVVWQEWLEDSVQRGVCLPEDVYLVKEGVPRPGRLVSSDDRSFTRIELERRRNGPIAQGEELEAAVSRKVTKPGSQSAILASIILQEDLPPPCRLSQSRLKPITMSQSAFNSHDELPDLDSILNDSNDFPDGTTSNPIQPQLVELMDRSKKLTPASLVRKLSSIRSEKFGNPSGSTEPTAKSQTWTSHNLFNGLKISIAGFRRTQHHVVGTAVSQCGGHLIEAHSLADYTIVPHINPPLVPPNCNPVAPNWIERCLFETKITDPDEHWATRPLLLSPFPDPEGYTFSSCGFNAFEEHTIRQALKSLKLNFIQHPRRSQVTHFFFGSDETSARLQKVRTWPEKQLVDFEWLIEMCEGRRVLRSTEATSPPITFKTPLKSITPLRSTSVDDYTPLEDCVIYLTKRGMLDSHSRSLVACRKLGARVVDKMMDSVTHVVHVSERANDPLREVKMARTKNLPVVHPCWLTECKNKQIRADEDTFLPTYRPGRALEYAISADSRSISQFTGPDSCSRKTRLPNDSAKGQPTLDLEEDPTFYNSSSQHPSPQTLQKSAAHDNSRSIAPCPATKSKALDRASGVENMALDSHLDADPFEIPGTENTRVQPHHSPFDAAARSSDHVFRNSSSPSHRSGPGVETQIGGFMEILQQRNPLTDFPSNSRDPESRRGRKRLLADSTRGTTVVPTKLSLGSDDLKTRSGGLHRTFSDFSHASTAASQVDYLDHPEESMKVTWEDPAAKREILKVINDPVRRAAKRLAERRQLSDDSWTLGLDSAHLTDTDHNMGDGSLPTGGEGVYCNPKTTKELGESADSTHMDPPVKRRKPRLIGAE